MNLLFPHPEQLSLFAMMLPFFMPQNWNAQLAGSHEMVQVLEETIEVCMWWIKCFHGSLIMKTRNRSDSPTISTCLTIDFQALTWFYTMDPIKVCWCMLLTYMSMFLFTWPPFPSPSFVFPVSYFRFYLPKQGPVPLYFKCHEDCWCNENNDINELWWVTLMFNMLFKKNKQTLDSKAISGKLVGGRSADGEIYKYWERDGASYCGEGVYRWVNDLEKSHRDNWRFIW